MMTVLFHRDYLVGTAVSSEGCSDHQDRLLNRLEHLVDLSLEIRTIVVTFHF